MVNPRLRRGSAYGGLIFPGGFGYGPGARSFWAKSIGRVGPLPGGFDRLPQDAAGRPGARRLPYTGITLSLGKEGLARAELAEWRWSLYRAEGLREQ